MSLRVRLALLMVLLTVLPALPAALLTRQLVRNSLHLGLSADVDAALEAGVRQARDVLLTQRRALQTTADRWATLWPGPHVAADAAIAKMRDAVATRERTNQLGDAPAISNDPDADRIDRVVLLDSHGRANILQEGHDDLRTGGAITQLGDAPRVIMARQPLEDGWALEVYRPVDARWHADATSLASTLQLIRGLKAQQVDLERAFWWPFLVIYGAAVIVGLLVALRLGQGITGPVHRLLGATDAVAAGRWDVQVPEAGRHEVGRLTQRFNAMVRTLDAQSRRLIDLETMAGWREMARALAHEIKNPLTPIQLTVEEMRERYSGSDAKYQALLDECTRIVVEEVDSLRSVVTRFREFSRPVELRMERVDLNRIVEDTAALQRDLDVHVETDTTVGEVDADADRLRQVLMNLAENARGATRGREPARMWLTTERHDESMIIRVEDNGPGVAKAERERIFEPYRSGSAGGLGLGLALVKGIVLAHGGTIEVTDGRVGGACFQIELPCRQPADLEAPSDSHAPARQPLESRQ